MASTIPSVPCVPDYTGCKYKSVTLNAGEQIILPPNAEIVSVSSDTALSFDSGCDYNLGQVESSACYNFRFSGPDGDSVSSRRENWEGFGDDNFFVTGITVDDTYYPFGSTITADQIVDWGTALNSISEFNGIFTNVTAVYDLDRSSGANRGWTVRVSLNTIPSIAKTMFFNITTYVFDQEDAVPSGSPTNAYVRAEPC